ncbi:MAG: glutamate racemase [Gemmatimonas sp.]|nr:glutamate racemase [Gemmatimonas sp.]
MSAHPLGIFDSGLGGLSVAREVRLRLPREDLLYIADSAYVPYGGRSLEEIRERSIAMTRELVEAGAKLVVAACNTASGAAIEALRETFAIPIVGLEPAVKPAAATSRKRRIAVLATPATLQTERFHRLVDNHGPGIDVVKVACPGFVELVESGEVTGERAAKVVRDVLASVVEADVDRVVLGCTHYPFLREHLTDVLGESVEILDSGAAVARQVERVLAANGLLRQSGSGDFRALTTGDPTTVAPIVDRLWGGPVDTAHVSI